ncbi:MAG: RIP metalloprotease RseP [Desulfofustis sp.]|jgi:regulator of sigma E protease|nr:RIP metalloprotease RseP [Desulfofustis sp.]
MNTLISFIIVLGILIFVHELGHFLFAKLFRVKVLRFSLGFGPKVVGKVLGETEYLISAVPLGGYVKMLGESPDDRQAGEDEDRSFAGKPVWQRFCIVLAGPLFNLLFSVVLFFAIFLSMGMPESRESTVVGEVNASSPAEQAGIAVNDRILAIDGRQVSVWLDVLNAVKNSDGRQLEFLVERDGRELAVTVTPQLDSVKNIFGEEQERRYMIGIVKLDEIEYRPAGLFEALQAAVWQTWMFIYLTFMGVVKIIQKVIPASELGGPILIAQLAGEQARAGLLNLAHFMGLLSVNLGILNLLPIPVLDGGHLVFLTIDGIRRKPISERLQIVAQQVGIALLGTLMIFVFYNDIIRLFS